MRVDMARMTFQMDGDYQIRLVRMPNVLRHRKPLLWCGVCRDPGEGLVTLRAYRSPFKDTWLKPVAVVGAFEVVVRNPSSVIRIWSVVVPKKSVRLKKRVSITRFLSFMANKYCACHQVVTSRSLVNLDQDAPQLTVRS